MTHGFLAFNVATPGILSFSKFLQEHRSTCGHQGGLFAVNSRDPFVFVGVLLAQALLANDHTHQLGTLQSWQRRQRVSGWLPCSFGFHRLFGFCWLFHSVWLNRRLRRNYIEMLAFGWRWLQVIFASSSSSCCCCCCCCSAAGGGSSWGLGEAQGDCALPPKSPPALRHETH